MASLVAMSVLFMISLNIWYLFRNKITNPLTRWPLLRQIGAFITLTRPGVHEFVTKMLEQCGYTAALEGPYFTKLDCILTSDPENIRYVLSSRASSNYNKGPKFRKNFEIWGDGILAADSESWQFQRRLNHSLFKDSQFLRMFEEKIRQKLECGLIPILDSAAHLGQEVDLRDLFQRFTLEITCKILLGTDLNSLSIGLPVVPFAKAFDEVKEVAFSRTFKPEVLWRLQRWMKFGLEGKGIEATAILNDFIYQQISSKRNSRVDKEVLEYDDADFDMVSRFMAVEDEASETRMPISDKFLRDSVMNILSAGRDPPSAALTWFFWAVSQHSSVEKKIKEELKVAFGLKEGEKWKFPSFQDLNKLVYLHAAIYETLRLYPSIPMNLKAAIQPDILPSGHRVGKQTEILISFYTQGRMESIWGADCLEFKPERWISEKGEIVNMGLSRFTAFSAGPRACLGKDLSMIEIKSAVAAIIWNYHFQVVDGHSVVPANSIGLYPKHGLLVHVTNDNYNQA